MIRIYFKKIFYTIIILIIISLTKSISVEANPPANVTSPFYYSFNSNGILYESGSESSSTSPYFWLNSGAKLIIQDGVGKTIQNELLSNDYWRLLYLNSNPTDTDNGYHPQNIFRLFTRSTWLNFQQTLYFKITKDELSPSPNRQGHNGLILLSRYLNSNNLYYVALRVDGYAVIKKKINGNYYTLTSRQVFPGTYNRLTNPNLLPKNTWLGLRSQIKNNADGTVTIKFYLDNGMTNNWTLLTQITDNNIGGPALRTGGSAGIRTDFMDVYLENYKLANI